MRTGTKKPKQLLEWPQHLQYSVVVPHGIKGHVQRYCRKIWGRPYYYYDLWEKREVTNPDGKWLYVHKDGVSTLWTDEPAGEEFITLILLKTS